MGNSLELHAIKVSQPYSDFYQVTISSDLLLKVCFKNPAKEISHEISGVQRDSSVPRAIEIAKFIDSDEASFPSSIILSANFDDEDRLLDEGLRWRFEQVKGSLYKLIIPDISVKACSIVDGQHRLLGFEYSKRKKIELTCAIYDALPPSGQASIFSTINFNQRKVDKSLAYQLFGYSLDENTRDLWSPDMLAVYFSRKLNNNVKSPFFNRIRYRVIDESRDEGWSVSSAVFVDGVLSLISKRPRWDRYEMNNSFISGKKGRARLSSSKDGSPLRPFFIAGNDRAIEELVAAYFDEVGRLFWTREMVDAKTVLVKTIGVAALFDVLKKYLSEVSVIDKSVIEHFKKRLSKVNPEVFLDKNSFPASTSSKVKIINLFCA
jgi:DNA phosphorothioation-associated DGQHR protein 1